MTFTTDEHLLSWVTHPKPTSYHEEEATPRSSLGWIPGRLCTAVAFVPLSFEKNQMFPVRPNWCGDRRFPGTLCSFVWGWSRVKKEWQGKTSTHNENAWIGARIRWSLLWNLAASPKKYNIFIPLAVSLLSLASIWNNMITDFRWTCRLWMVHTNTPPVLPANFINHVWYIFSCLWFTYRVQALATQQQSIRHASCLLTLVTVRVRMCMCAVISVCVLCVCMFSHACQHPRLCVSNTVSDVTRGDLMSVFSILFLSWHVEPRFSVVTETVSIDSFSVSRRQICVKCSPLLSEMFLMIFLCLSPC